MAGDVMLLAQGLHLSRKTSLIRLFYQCNT